MEWSSGIYINNHVNKTHKNKQLASIKNCKIIKVNKLALTIFKYILVKKLFSEWANIWPLKKFRWLKLKTTAFFSLHNVFYFFYLKTNLNTYSCSSIWIIFISILLFEIEKNFILMKNIDVYFYRCFLVQIELKGTEKNWIMAKNLLFFLI